MSLLVVAYPVLNETDFDLIENQRKVSDPLQKVIAPHFTFVFPVVDFPADEFCREIRAQLNNIYAFPFLISRAIGHRDEFTGNHLALLVPGPGAAQIANVHDLLYSGLLRKHLRRDLPFVPHVTIGTFTDELSRKVVEEWNSKNVEIRGIISSLDILTYENDRVETIQKIILLSEAS